MREITDFMRANPQVLILLIVCLVLGIGTFLIVLSGVASSGSTQTNGYPSDVIFGLRALL
ncbi:MAG TPA: hypothetical protein VGH56_09215 [Solirubrobacteraceae bacterium]